MGPKAPKAFEGLGPRAGLELPGALGRMGLPNPAHNLASARTYLIASIAILSQAHGSSYAQTRERRANSLKIGGQRSIIYVTTTAAIFGDTR